MKIKSARRLLLSLVFAAVLIIGSISAYAIYQNNAYDYTINGISVKINGEYVESIPSVDFSAEVSVTNRSEAGPIMVLLTAYSDDGQMLRAQYQTIHIGTNETLTCAFDVANANGKVSSLKAFLLNSESELIPVAQAFTLSRQDIVVSAYMNDLDELVVCTFEGREIVVGKATQCSTSFADFEIGTKFNLTEPAGEFDVTVFVDDASHVVSFDPIYYDLTGKSDPAAVAAWYYNSSSAYYVPYQTTVYINGSTDTALAGGEIEICLGSTQESYCYTATIQDDGAFSVAHTQGDGNGTVWYSPLPLYLKWVKVDTKGSVAEEPVLGDTILIGHICDLTGNESSIGALSRKAVDFAAKLINANGGIGGRNVEIITVDSQSNAAAAAAAVRTLAAEGVVAILGPTQIGHKQAVAPVAADVGIPVICYNNTPVFLSKKNEYFMSSGGSTSQMPTVMADYLYNELGLRKIYCISQEGTAGDNYIGPLKTNFVAMGGTVIQDIRVPGDAIDISQYLLNVTDDADAIIGWLSGTQGLNLWTVWYDLGLADKMPLYGANSTGFTDYFIWKQLANSRPEVVEKAMEWGVYVPVTWAYSVDNDVNKAFVKAWQTEYGELPPGTALPGGCYTSLLLLKAVIESIEGEITGAAVYQALQNAEVDGAEGHTAFNGGKMAAKAVYIAKVVKLDDGTFNYEVVKTYGDVPVDGLVVG